MKIEHVPYTEQWPRDFDAIRDTLDAALGEVAMRIDHIGSTSIPGMAAKDCVDIQVTVATLDAADIVARFEAAGFVQRPYFTDHEPPSWTGGDAEWRKMVFAPPDGMRLCNVHVRETGRANQRYALLFRDYLRSDPAAVRTWIELKRRLGEQDPNDLEAYGLVKDIATDVLMFAAEQWASRSGWTP